MEGGTFFLPPLQVKRRRRRGFLQTRYSQTAMAAVRSRQIVRNGLGGEEEERRHSRHVPPPPFVHWMRERERESGGGEDFSPICRKTKWQMAKPPVQMEFLAKILPNLPRGKGKRKWGMKQRREEHASGSSLASSSSLLVKRSREGRWLSEHHNSKSSLDLWPPRKKRGETDGRDATAAEKKPRRERTGVVGQLFPCLRAAQTPTRLRVAFFFHRGIIRVSFPRFLCLVIFSNWPRGKRRGENSHVLLFPWRGV